VTGDFKYSEYKDFSTGTTGLTDSKWLTGMRYGIGLQTTLNQNILMRLVYSFLKYQNYVNTTFPMPAGQSRRISLTPDSNQIELDLLYQF